MANEEKKVSQITPMDIHNKEFKRRGRNGYDRYEVDKFLDEIVDDYGDALDQVVDLKNKEVDLNKKLDQFEDENENLKNELQQYRQREQEVNEVLVSAQESATRIKKEAQEKADSIINDAKNQIATDTKFEQQQKDTLAEDYDRLKEEVGSFRAQLQEMLKKQITILNDDQWQKALDKYFDTDRYYPEDGSEPIPTANDESKKVDKSAEDALESSHKPTNDDTKPIVGDSPSEETIDVKPQRRTRLNAGPTIIFPDDYKDRKN